MVRVLQVLPRLRRGGSQAMVMNLYRTIDRTKVQFDFIIFTEDHDDYYDEIIALGGRVYHFEKFNGKNYLRIKHNWEKFLEEHPEYKVLHIHVYSTASLYIPIAKKKGLTTIIHSHSTSNGRGIKAMIKNTLQLPLRYQADYLFACSRDAGKWLYGKNAPRKSNYRFVPNGIPIKQFVFSPSDRKRIRSEFNLYKSFVIGHVGGFETPKNHPFIIRVFAELLKSYNNATLLLVGDGTYEEAIRDKCIELGIINNVVFAGLQTNVAPFLSAMDCFFFPSLWEGLPVSVVEAAVSGLDCLISETITKDVLITDNIEYLSLDAPIERWIDRLLSYKGKTRTEAILTEKALQFDANKVACEMERFYLDCYKAR